MRFLMRLLCQKDFVETKRYAFHGCWVLFGPQAFHGQEPLFTNYALSGSQTEPFVATLDAQISLRELPGAPWCMDYVWK